MQHCSKAGFKSVRSTGGHTGSFLTLDHHKKNPFVFHEDYPGVYQLNPAMNFQTCGKKVTVSSPGGELSYLFFFVDNFFNFLLCDGIKILFNPVLFREGWIMNPSF
jgi:hypothetical protein